MNKFQAILYSTVIPSLIESIKVNTTVTAAEVAKNAYKRVHSEFDLALTHVAGYDEQVVSMEGVFQAVKVLYIRQKQTLDREYETEVDKRTKLVDASANLKLRLFVLKNQRMTRGSKARPARIIATKEEHTHIDSVMCVSEQVIECLGDVKDGEFDLLSLLIVVASGNPVSSVVIFLVELHLIHKFPFSSVQLVPEQSHQLFFCLLLTPTCATIQSKYLGYNYYPSKKTTILRLLP